jgi:hypothetical protein
VACLGRTLWLPDAMKRCIASFLRIVGTDFLCLWILVCYKVSSKIVDELMRYKHKKRVILTFVRPHRGRTNTAQIYPLGGVLIVELNLWFLKICPTLMKSSKLYLLIVILGFSFSKFKSYDTNKTTEKFIEFVKQENYEIDKPLFC